MRATAHLSQSLGISCDGYASVVTSLRLIGAFVAMTKQGVPINVNGVTHCYYIELIKDTSHQISVNNGVCARK